MEKGLNAYIREKFQIKEADIRTYSPLTLAFIGDGIFDLIIRSVVVGRGNAKANTLHHRTSHIVKAHTQAEMIHKLLPQLTEEEQAVYRRGRNANSHSKAKNATLSEYKNATALEALFGYLYLTGRMERVLELLKLQ